MSTTTFESTEIATSNRTTQAIASEKEQFWQVKIDELRTLYKKKWITATAYVYGIVKILRQDGWWLKFDTKEFAKEHGIPQASLYRAITALAADPDIDFEWSAKEIRVRFGKASILTDEKTSKTPESIDLSLVHSQQGELISSVRMDSHERENFLIRENGFSSVRMETPETPTQQSVQQSYRYLTDIKQTHTDNALANATPLPHPEEVCVLKNQEEEQPRKQFQDSGTVGIVQKKDSSSEPKINHEDRSSAPRENVSQNQNWQCPDPKLRREFMGWLANNARGIQSARHAANWCNKNGKNADLAWDDFMTSRNKAAAQIASFASWGSDRHEMLLRQYKTYSDVPVLLDGFLVKNSDWLQWVTANHPEWLEDAFTY